MSYTYDPNHPIQLTSSQLDNILGNDTPCVENLHWAAQLGADMQLGKCCEWLREEEFLPRIIQDFMAAMRPRPLSKREQALKLLDVSSKYKQAIFTSTQVALLREALMIGGQGDD